MPLIVLLPIASQTFVTNARRIEVPRQGNAGANAARLESLIDPNTAPWWELTVLPRIGAVLAKRIVAYRSAREAHMDHRPVFRRPEDLEQVRGIGPKTVERLRPHLTIAQRATPRPRPVD